MIRVTLLGEDIKAKKGRCEGANCKIYLPDRGQSREAFEQQLSDGPRPTVRTYTVRHIRAESGELDIDFVDHGDHGPASAWARAAKPGAFCGFGGPGPVKLKCYYADDYLLAADMSAIPLVAASLEAMPEHAEGDAYFEILDRQDQQYIRAPKGIRQHWMVVTPQETPGDRIVEAILKRPWAQGTVQTCIAGERGMIKQLRAYISVERETLTADSYISGYWKVGLVEDEHQKMKRAEADDASPKRRFSILRDYMKTRTISAIWFGR
jgi:NADPH-dependent ferric siderophore reductase